MYVFISFCHIPSSILFTGSIWNLEDKSLLKLEGNYWENWSGVTQSWTFLLELISGRSVHLQRLHKPAFTEPPAKLQVLIENKGLYSTKWCVADHYVVSLRPALTRAQTENELITKLEPWNLKGRPFSCIIVWLCWWRQLKKAAHRRHRVTTGSMPECFFLLFFFVCEVDAGKKHERRNLVFLSDVIL